MHAGTRVWSHWRSGQLVALGGRDENLKYNGYSEIYTEGSGWRTLTGAYIEEFNNASDLSAHVGRIRRQAHHIRCRVWSRHRLCHRPYRQRLGRGR